MTENQPTKPLRMLLNVLIAVLTFIADSLSAAVEWAWETWKDFWFGILVALFVLFVLYMITKPGWDEVAAGRSFFLSEFDARNRIVQDCLKSEFGYTRDECIRLAARSRS